MSSFSRGLNDTSPDAEAVHLALLRDAGPERRATLALSLSATVLTLSRRAIADQMPGASENDVAIRFVEFEYGLALGRDLRRYFEAHHK